MSELTTAKVPADSSLVITAQDQLRDQLDDLLTEVTALAIRLRQDARRVQSAGDKLPAGGHSVLRMLRRFGTLTVPQLARLDSTSRQNIQTAVNRLKSEGCVELAPNPAHKRSELVRLTERGIASVALITHNAEASRDKILPHVSKEDVTRASELLRSIRKELSRGAALPADEDLHNEKAPRATREARRTETKTQTRLPERVQLEPSPTQENELPVSLL